MKRRDFFALVPSLSAIPFIGTSAVLKDNKIEIINPTPIIDIKPISPGEFNLMQCELQVVRNNQVIARGHISSISMNVLDVRFDDQIIRGPREINIEGCLREFNI